MMDVMKAAFDEALKRQKDKRVKLEITIGGDEEEDPTKKSPDLAPEVKDSEGPKDDEKEVEVEVEPKDEAASVLEQMPEPDGGEPKTFDEKAAASFKKKLAQDKK